MLFQFGKPCLLHTSADLHHDLGGDGVVSPLGMPVLITSTSNFLGSLQIRIAWARQRYAYWSRNMPTLLKTLYRKPLNECLGH